MDLPLVAAHVAEQLAAVLELMGVAAIAISIVYALMRAVQHVYSGKDWGDIYQNHRLDFSRGVLLGLDFLVGADIVHTVAVEVSSMSIAVLGLVVLIRAFLIFSLEIEITGRLPWQRPVPGDNVRPG